MLAGAWGWGRVGCKLPFWEQSYGEDHMMQETDVLRPMACKELNLEDSYVSELERGSSVPVQS